MSKPTRAWVERAIALTEVEPAASLANQEDAFHALLALDTAARSLCEIDDPEKHSPFFAKRFAKLKAALLPREDKETT